jgi:hypothetical protein
VNLFLQTGQANFPCSSSKVVLWLAGPAKSLGTGVMEFELTVGLMPRQILDAAEILGTPRTLEPLARGRWGGLWL